MTLALSWSFEPTCYSNKLRPSISIEFIVKSIAVTRIAVSLICCSVCKFGSDKMLPAIDASLTLVPNWAFPVLFGYGLFMILFLISSA